MRIGLALPQYDYSIAGEDPLSFTTLVDTARAAEAHGFDSVWLSDHLRLDIEKYGGRAEPYGVFEPLTTLGALATMTERVRLGTLVMCEALRPAAMLAKSLATLDRISGGRIDVGLGAGWYEPDYAAIGMAMPSPGERIDRLAETADVVTGMLAGDPFTYDGRHHAVRDGRALPGSVQQPRPPVFLGGKGDRLIKLAVERTDGWNTCWVWTHEDYAERRTAMLRACDSLDRDPDRVWQSIGLYALCGENEADLEARFERLAERTPRGVLTGVRLAEWRVGRLVGTVSEVREHADRWQELGIETIIAGVGAVPFQLSDPDDVALLGHALGSS